MILDLSDEETTALLRLLSTTIDDDRYPLSPRVQTLRAILAKLRPEPVLKAYLDRFASEVQHFFPVAKGSPVEAFKDLAPRYPVFELQPLD